MKAIVLCALLAAACGGKSKSEPPPTGGGGECAQDACGPALGMPAQKCGDGSIGGNTGRCIKNPDGSCGWEIRECPQSASDCIRTGCSGTVCAEPGNEVVTTCEMKPEYACYADALCERQADGKCGWTETPALKTCVATPPKP